MRDENNETCQLFDWPAPTPGTSRAGLTLSVDHAGMIRFISIRTHQELGVGGKLAGDEGVKFE